MIGYNIMKHHHVRISRHEVIHPSEQSRQDTYFECITDCHYNDEPCNEKCVNILKTESSPRLQ